MRFANCSSVTQRKTENEEEKQRGIVSTDLLGARGFKHLGPVSSIEEFSSELFGKVRICKVWPVVVLHKLSDGRSRLSLPVPPKPLGRVAGHGKHAPMDEDAQLWFVIPAWQRSGIDGGPVGLVVRSAGLVRALAHSCQCQKKQKASTHYFANSHCCDQLLHARALPSLRTRIPKVRSNDVQDQDQERHVTHCWPCDCKQLFSLR